MRRWAIAVSVAGVALVAAVAYLLFASGHSPPTLPAGSVASLAVSVQATPGGQAAARFTTADGAKIEALTAVLRRGRAAEDHMCGETASLAFRLRDGSDVQFELLAGHDPRYYEFRAYSKGGYGIFRVDRPALERAMSGLGVGALDAAQPE